MDSLEAPSIVSGKAKLEGGGQANREEVTRVDSVPGISLTHHK